MNEDKSKKYDLEERTEGFARRVRSFLAEVSKNILNNNDINQLLRSSGSVGANYIEANESLGKKDFLMKVKICRKESKETRYWLRLLVGIDSQALIKECDWLIQESTELLNIFGAIIRKVEDGVK